MKWLMRVMCWWDGHLWSFMFEDAESLFPVIVKVRCRRCGKDSRSQ